MALASRQQQRAPWMPLAVAVNLVLGALLATGHAPWALAVGVLVPLGLALAQRPQLGLLLLVALAPFNGLLLIVPHPGIVNGWKEGLVLATLVATFVTPPGARAAPRTRPLTGWAPAAGGLLVLGALSAVSVGGFQAILGLKVSFFYMLVAVTVWRCPLDARERDRLVTILIVTGLLVSLVGILQQVMGPARLNALGYHYNSAIRTTGSFLRSFSTFNQPFGFAYYVMVVVLIGIPHALSDTRRPRNRLFLFTLPIFGLGLATTFVRGAFLGLLVGVAYLGSHRYRILLLAIPAAMLMLLFLPADLARPTLGTSSGQQRVTGWKDNLDRVVTSPLGVGLGATGSASEKVAKQSSQAAQVTQAGEYQPDNYYVKTVLELGVLGLWLLVLLLMGTFASTRAAARRLPGSDAALASGVSAMVLAAAASALVATYFEIFPMDLLFWLLVTVVATCDTR